MSIRTHIRFQTNSLIRLKYKIHNWVNNYFIVKYYKTYICMLLYTFFHMLVNVKKKREKYIIYKIVQNKTNVNNYVSNYAIVYYFFPTILWEKIISYVYYLV